MSDVRRLNLEESSKKKIKMVSPEAYKLGLDKMTTLEKVFPELERLNYWDPEYQAWCHFVMAYLQSGVVPELAQKWLPRFLDKDKLIGPKPGKYNDIFSEVVRLNRVSSTEVFVGYNWEEIEEFVEWIPNYIDNPKAITKLLFDAKNYTQLMTCMLELKSDREKELGFSANLHAAVYLYRHCMIDGFIVNAQLREKLQNQLDLASSTFEKHFDIVSSFIGNTSNVYQWYSPQIRDLISNAWRTSLDLTSRRKTISANDVYSMPVWLAEQITDYISGLPCVYTENPDGVFIINALEVAMKRMPDFNDPQMVYAFCIPKSYLKRFLETLSMFYWDVKENRFINMLVAVVSEQYRNNPEAKSPEEYCSELLARNFPLEEM